VDTLQFLQKITPDQGTLIVGELRKNGSFGHTAYDNHEAMAAGIAAKVNQGKNVYHANNSFSGKRRLQDDAVFAKSLFLDVDVSAEEYAAEVAKGAGIKHYPSVKAAQTAIVDSVKAMGLPQPMIVFSGGGYHLYWPFTLTVPIEDWQPVADKLKAACKHVGFHIDPAVPADASRVLRPLGAQNPKRSSPAELLRDADEHAVGHLDALLTKYLGTHADPDEFDLSGHKSSGRFETEADLSNHNTIESSAKIIVTKCIALADIVNEPEKANEPSWRGMIGLVKHCIEGDELAHEWSKGHPGYNAKETQKKLDNWEKPPTTCEFFDDQGLCGGCRVKSSKMKSPIALGTEDVIVTPTVRADGKPQTLPWPFKWNKKEQQLEREFKDEEGNKTRRAVCNTLVLAKTRIRTSDGTWALLCDRMKYYDPDIPANSEWEEFTVPTKFIGKTAELMGHLGGYEIYPMNKQSETDIRELFKAYGNGLRYERTETITYDNFGFTGDRFNIAETTDKFILGTTAINLDGTEEPALCSDSVNREWCIDFGTSGTAEDWSYYINQVYNKPGAAAMQYAILLGFAAPLVSLSSRPDWHGIPTALIGDSGVGKTTVALAACSIYGKQTLFEIKANKSGSTANALVQRLATAKNVPLTFDEASTLDTEAMCEFLYACSNGKVKDRLDTNGKPKDDARTWDTLTFLTSNKSLVELVSKAKQAGVQDATMVRMFEIRIDDYIRPEFYTEGSAHILRYDLPNHYGTVGRKWIRFLMSKRFEIEAVVIEQERLLEGIVGEVIDTAERFQLRAIATVMAAGHITKKLGFHDFDMKEIKDFAVTNLNRMRDSRQALKQSALDLVSRYLTFHNDGIVKTRLYPTGKQRTSTNNTEIARVHGEIVGRIAHTDKKIYISGPHFTEWLADRGVSARSVVHDLYTSNVLQVTKAPKPSDSIRKYQKCVSLGKGTDVTTGQTWCFDFNYNKLTAGGAALAPVGNTTQGEANESN
jgi:hypothetical protein